MKNKKTLAIDEISIFHPLVASWLQENGYAYEYEYKLPDFGRVDFLAQKGKAKTLIECKSEFSQIKKSILQVSAYRMQIPEYLAAIAIPQEWGTSEIYDIAKRYEVSIIEIALPKNIESLTSGEGVTWTREYNSSVAMKADWLEFFDYMGQHPDKALASRITKSFVMLIMRSINQAYNDEVLSALSELIKFQDIIDKMNDDN